MNERIGVVGIVVEDLSKAPEINSILSRHNEIIIGRMGLPRVHHHERGVSVIAIIVQGSTDDVGALTGQLGSVRGVQVKSALAANR